MPRKQRTKIEGSDPNYHSDLPRKPIAEATTAIKPALKIRRGEIVYLLMIAGRSC